MAILNENGSVNYKAMSKMKKEEIIEFLSTLKPEQIRVLFEEEKKTKKSRIFTTCWGAGCTLICAGAESNAIIQHVKNNEGTEDLGNIILAGLVICALLYITATQASELVLSSKFVKITRQYLLENYPQLFIEEGKHKKQSN